jgi:hypothetical protein
MRCNIFKLENEHLKDDNCFLAMLINVSENIFIEKNMLVLERHDDVISINLEDIFINNFIQSPTLDANVNKQYFAESCDDLKPFIKTLSWKDTRFLITEENEIRYILGKIFLDLEKNVFLNVYVNNYKEIINLWNSKKWGIKLQSEQKGFAVYKNKIVFFNIDQFNNLNIKNETLNLIKLIKEKIDE